MSETATNAGPIPFDNTYSALPDRLFTRQAPTPVKAPVLLAANTALGSELGIDGDWLLGDEALQVFAGNTVPANADPLAQVYAGHQFGGWSHQLGDGRAILLGEVIGTDGTRRDIQLKGSGRTPYSRGGDGRAWLGPVLREFVVSEAMHALGIPTTRALAAVASGDLVQRETQLPGAVLTRVAASHIRVGTFQYFAARQDHEALKILTDYAMNRHYPEAESPLNFLNGVIARQAELIAKWMSVGFIHGVMNTDNMTISGETIDYGPCAFMDHFNPDMVYSSIDRQGRYRFSNQPDIAVWNLAQLASSLLPLMGDQEAAVADATKAVHRFPEIFAQHWLRLFSRKLGLSSSKPGDRALIEGFLQGLHDTNADFTNSFRDLAEQRVPHGMRDWKTDWVARLALEDGDTEATIRAANPVYIARNHRIEEMISAATDGDMAPFKALSGVLARPFDAHADMDELRAPPQPNEVVQATFCGT